MPKRIQLSPAVLARQIEAWNANYPVGTKVEYHSVIGNPKHIVTTTRSEASLLGDHTAVVFLEGVAGCVALIACVPLNN